MIFTSLQFILVFLPLSILTMVLVGRLGRPRVTGAAVILLSVIFYAGFGWASLCVLTISALGNYFLARWAACAPQASMPLVVGVTANLFLLGAFKYFNDVALAFASPISMITVVGISYFTFQQITYLFQVQAGRIQALPFVDYLQFVIFFPTLVSGPIPRASELSGSYRDPQRVTALGMQVGIAMICIGLAKKVLIADQISPAVDTVFAVADVHLSPLLAWRAAFAFTFQVYFDFSGYSDIAIGAAHILGVHLPINFLSPLRATSIQDFWRRWHMTMTRFFSDFVYAPLAIGVTRRAMRSRPTRVQMFVLTVALPTVVTFVLVGFWHDAGINFLLFGLLHGLGLSLYQWGAKSKRKRWPPLLGWASNFIFLVFTLVLFRAPDFDTALRVWLAMVGLSSGGLALVPPLPAYVMAALLAAVIVAMVSPSTYEFMSGYLPSRTGTVPIVSSKVSRWFRWQPNIPWAIILGLVGSICLTMAARGGVTNFVYVRF